MDQQEFFSALLAFLLGLLAKFIYDIWNERRKRKTLFISKTTISSFTLGSLEKDIREQIEVYYKKLPITSIKLIRVNIENTGWAAIRNQVITIRFSKDAQIIGEPTSDSSSENLRYVETDKDNLSSNTRRFLIKLLRKDASLSWNVAVINHTDNDFVVEHGISTLDKDITESDIDVSSTITNQKIALDVASRFRRIITYSILTQIVALTRDSFVFGFQDLAKPIMNVVIIFMLAFLIREFAQSITPILEWINGTLANLSPKTDMDFAVSGSVSESTIAISTNTGHITMVHQPINQKRKEVLEGSLVPIESDLKYVEDKGAQKIDGNTVSDPSVSENEEIPKAN